MHVIRRLPKLALECFTEHAYGDVRGGKEVAKFRETFSKELRRQIQNLVIRARNVTLWTMPIVYPQWPSLKTLTIYEDYCGDSYSGRTAGLEGSWKNEFAHLQHSMPPDGEVYQALSQIVHQAPHFEETLVDCLRSNYVMPVHGPNPGKSAEPPRLNELLAAKQQRPFVVELVWGIHDYVDMVMEVDKEGRPMRLVEGMQCEKLNILALKLDFDEEYSKMRVANQDPTQPAFRKRLPSKKVISKSLARSADEHYDGETETSPSG